MSSSVFPASNEDAKRDIDTPSRFQLVVAGVATLASVAAIFFMWAWLVFGPTWGLLEAVRGQ